MSHASATSRTPRSCAHREIRSHSSDSDCGCPSRSRPRIEPRSNRNPATPRSANRSSEAITRSRGDRVRGAQDVAAAGIVDVTAVGSGHVVRAVGDAPQLVRRTGLVLLRAVVVDDVEPHRDPTGRGRGAQRSELGGAVARRRIVVVDRQPTQRHVPPVAALTWIGGVDGQQLDHRHAELRQVVEAVDQSGVRAATPVGDARVDDA